MMEHKLVWHCLAMASDYHQLFQITKHNLAAWRSQALPSTNSDDQKHNSAAWRWQAIAINSFRWPKAQFSCLAVASHCHQLFQMTKHNLAAWLGQAISTHFLLLTHKLEGYVLHTCMQTAVREGCHQLGQAYLFRDLQHVHMTNT